MPPDRSLRRRYQRCAVTKRPAPRDRPGGVVPRTPSPVVAGTRDSLMPLAVPLLQRPLGPSARPRPRRRLPLRQPSQIYGGSPGLSTRLIGFGERGKYLCYNASVLPAGMVDRNRWRLLPSPGPDARSRHLAHPCGSRGERSGERDNTCPNGKPGSHSFGGLPIACCRASPI